MGKPSQINAYRIGILSLSGVIVGALSIGILQAAAWAAKTEMTESVQTEQSVESDMGTETLKESKASKTEMKTSATTDVTKLEIKDQKVGAGTVAESGKTVKVQYTGTLYPSGKKFDSSYDHGQPFSFKLGSGQVISGWDEGIVGMKEGGKRTLLIPPDKGYGAQGYPPVIPKSATLKFDVELLEVK